MIVAAKLFTYVSYGHVPLATAQIAKAATPVATVLMTRAVLSERFGWQSLASLVPIMLGVCLGVGVGVVHFNLIGIVAALISCVIAAAQTIYMKTLFMEEEGSRMPALSLNVAVACWCVLLLLPLWLGVQLGVLPAKFDGGRPLTSSPSTQALLELRMLAAVVFGALTQFVQSACAYLFIEQVSPATSAVVGTARRPFIVIASVILFSTPITVLNVHGILLAFGGVFWYTHARRVEACEASHQRVATTDEALGLATESEEDEEATQAQGGRAEAPRGSKSNGHRSTQGRARSTAAHAGEVDVRAWYEDALARRPLLVKAAASAALYGVGDLCAQTAQAVHVHQLRSAAFGSGRLMRAVVYGGLFYAPLAHAHYNFLEYLVVRRWKLARSMVPWAKMGMEQFVYWSYFSNAYYHVVIGMLQGLEPLACLEALVANFWSTMIAQWVLWVPVQLLNFRYIPVRHQLGFTLLFTLLWTTFLAAAYPPAEGALPPKYRGG